MQKGTAIFLYGFKAILNISFLIISLLESASSKVFLQLCFPDLGCSFVLLATSHFFL